MSEEYYFVLGPTWFPLNPNDYGGNNELDNPCLFNDLEKARQFKAIVQKKWDTSDDDPQNMFPVSIVELKSI